MFKPRKAPSAVPATPPAIEVVRQRAKHRLIGASLLVLVGVVVFPVLFDTQPRPIPVDVPIEIPSRQTAKPLAAVPVPLAAEEPLGTEKSLSQREEVIEPRPRAEATGAAAKLSPTLPTPPAPPAPVKADKPERPEKVEKAEKAEKPEKSDKTAQSEPKPEPKPVPKSAVVVPAPPAPAPAPSAKEAQRAQALLDGHAATRPSAVAPASGGERFIVQVGAFADAAMAQQVRLKLERAGLKTYTHVADLPEGRRTRVRLGPFTSKADADKAATKAKGLGLAASILSL